MSKSSLGAGRAIVSGCVQLRKALPALALLFSSAAAAQTAEVFRAPLDGALPVDAAVSEGTLRSRLVKVDLERLGRVRTAAADRLSTRGDRHGRVAQPVVDGGADAGTSLRLELFDGFDVTVLVDWTEPTFSGGYSLSGGLLEDPLGSMTLVVNGDRVVGSVDTGGRSFRIRAVGDRLHAISEVEEPPLVCGVDGLPLDDGHVH